MLNVGVLQCNPVLKYSRLSVFKSVGLDWSNSAWDNFSPLSPSTESSAQYLPVHENLIPYIVFAVGLLSISSMGQHQSFKFK